MRNRGKIKSKAFISRVMKFRRQCGAALFVLTNPDADFDNPLALKCIVHTARSVLLYGIPAWSTEGYSRRFLARWFLFRALSYRNWEIPNGSDKKVPVKSTAPTTSKTCFISRRKQSINEPMNRKKGAGQTKYARKTCLKVATVRSAAVRSVIFQREAIRNTLEIVRPNGLQRTHFFTTV